MRIGIDLIKGKEPPPIPEEVPEEKPEDKPWKKFSKFSSFLKSAAATKTPAVFSSDNSLKMCYCYGDIDDYIEIIEDCIKALMLDQRFDHESWHNRRHKAYIRTLFVTDSRDLPDVGTKMYNLRQASLRLSEGFELRKQHPELGVFVNQNLNVAESLLTDLENFFMELFNELRYPGRRS